ncbi:uncharacterized protein GGS25DRAFT_508832 [Hypoxylon fragiforme]|uniref:uncharacterized protein n=1 Tax=Hypoxylon fragiforme TaxID=63214 RepID=UPI0020C6776C|nr:uncharacterized protein GGS25DRAFT_508832 [Hypoxylon fragiforme]KAI2604562.1 hypothetical protein GGS25DRAFT_508832 [Hypoxylon fragiforme]
MIARQNAFLRALADANPAVFEMRTSTLEGPLHEGLYLRAPPSPTSPSASSSSSSSSSSEDPQDPQALEAKLRARLGRGTGGGEFAHVHGEGSAHVTLSPGDAATAIRAGWAERHQMSGVGGPKLAMVPWGYVMVYAPREGEEGEWQAWKDVVMAGARYVAQGRGVEVVVPS